jgi:predicted RNA-binding Zn-ribbon protein involved in translation (DUF1610 family)
VSSPRILIYDLETIPNLSKALHAWPGLSDFPGRTLKASLSSICCFGYKIFGEDAPARVICAWDFPEWERNVNDDRALLEKVLPLFEDVDAVITQNGKAFDEKVLQTRLLLNDLPAIPPGKHVDTKQLAKKFSFFSNSLKYLCEQLTEKRKQEHEGWNLWVRVHGDLPRRRDPLAEEEMRGYCAQDVEATEALYRKLRRAESGKNTTANHNLFAVAQGGKNVCPTCGSSRLRSHGLRANNTMTYRRYQCLDCGASSRTDLRDRLPRPL